MASCVPCTPIQLHKGCPFCLTATAGTEVRQGLLPDASLWHQTNEKSRSNHSSTLGHLVTPPLFLCLSERSALKPKKGL